MACILARLSLDYIHHLQTITTALTSPLQLDGSLSASSCTILLQSIRELLTTSGPTVFISINEVNLQYHSTSSLADEYTPETLLLRALDSDTTNQNKLRVPFVATVAMMPHSVSPIAYQELRQQLPHGEVAELPAIPAHPKVLTPLMGELDYWLRTGECKQIKSRDLIGGMELHREPCYQSDREALFQLELASSIASLTNKKRKTMMTKWGLTTLGSDDHVNEWFTCDVSKLMMTFENPTSVWIDGVHFEEVEFMNVSSRFYSKVRNFPLCVPFARESDD